jgi:hypothetical protein
VTPSLVLPNALLQVHVTEQFPRPIVRTTHDSPPSCLKE